MELIINTEESYPVVIERQLLDNIANTFKHLGYGTNVCIVTDSNVHTLYTNKLESALISAGVKPYKIVLPPSESSKNLDIASQLIMFLGDAHFSKSDVLISLGGGVIGDLTGFVASIYLRGISFYQIPTTLLAAVDSSVGGKNGVNLPYGKNMVGTIWQPKGVFFDPKVLETLPGIEILNGLSEMIKSAIIGDSSLFNDIERAGKEGLGEIIDECIFKALSVKKTLVEKDVNDQDTRNLLNLGHTLGHSIEKCSDYKIPHGRAVAIGINLISRVAVVKSFMKEPTERRINHLMTTFGIDLTCPYTLDELLKHVLIDKKIKNGIITLIIPLEIGYVQSLEIPLAELRDFLEPLRNEL